MRSPTIDLDAVEDLLARDSDGYLSAVALAGAGVRAIAEAQREGVLAALSGLRPRSVVLVTGSSTVGADAVRVVVAHLAARIDVPLVHSPTLPGWIGPLDVVVLVGDDAGDPAIIDAGARAARRRAEIVSVTPLEGPLRDAVAGQVINLSPRLPVATQFRFSAIVAALLAVCVGLESVRITGSVPDLDDVAAALDGEAAANHPSREVFHNEAKLVASKIVERETFWTGDDSTTTEVAVRAHNALTSIAGVGGGALGLPAAAAAVLAHSTRPGGAADSIFYDPEFDGPASVPPQLFVLTTVERQVDTRRRLGAVNAELLIAGEDDPTVGSQPTPHRRDDLMGYLVLTLRVEMAAVYLRLLEAGGL